MREKQPPVFHLPPQFWGEPLALSGPEAAHAARVLRLRPGDRIRLIDGLGRLAVCRIETVAKDRLGLTLIEQSLAERPPARLHLAPGFSKSSRRGYLIEKAAELGAVSLCFWAADRSQGELPGRPKESWLAQAAAGAKQSGNPFIPELHALPGLAALIDFAERLDHRLVAVEPGLAAGPVDPDTLRRPGDALLVLGPEGGLAEAEVRALDKAGFTRISLGPNTLRLETAAVAAMSLWHWARAWPLPDTERPA